MSEALFFQVRRTAQWRLLLVLCCFVLLVTGCNKKRIRVAVPGAAGPSALDLPAEERIGYASWYGDPYHGRRTSNGEIYNKLSMTAAHRTLPFDTLVNVRNLENNRRAQVRINDRGPFVKDRVIDLSLSAARQIDMVRAGTAKVSLEVIKGVPNPFLLTIQVASFKEKSNAEKLRSDLRSQYHPVVVRKYASSQGSFFRVLVGEFSDRQDAAAVLRTLKASKHEGFVVRLDP